MDVVENFLRTQTDMRGTLPEAREVLDRHTQLLNELNVLTLKKKATLERESKDITGILYLDEGDGDRSFVEVGEPVVRDSRRGPGPRSPDERRSPARRLAKVGF